MISIRKFWWTGLALAAFAGCNTDESAPTTAGPEPTTNVPAPTNPPGGPPPAATSTTPGGPPGAVTSEPGKEKADTSKTEPPPAAPPIEQPKTKADENKDADKKDDEKKAENAKLSDDELANIKKLPEADQAIALKQVVCPVSEEHLGEMGTPVKVTAEGRTFFLCCKSCEKKVKSDPKAVVANLKN